jgi:tellurite resistance protein TehA-like permease
MLDRMPDHYDHGVVNNFIRQHFPALKHCFNQSFLRMHIVHCTTYLWAVLMIHFVCELSRFIKNCLKNLNFPLVCKSKIRSTIVIIPLSEYSTWNIRFKMLWLCKNRNNTSVGIIQQYVVSLVCQTHKVNN